MITLPPLLMTSCVTATALSAQLRDQNTRIELTVKSIAKWLSITNDLKIIICDGSNYDFSSIIAKSFPSNDIECLYFNNDSKSVALYGKGYGEGEIIKYALENSVFLNEAKYFAKCTAKLWVDNLSDCLRYWNGTFLCDCNFSYFQSNKFITFKSIDTSFYIVDKQFYVKNFLSAYVNVRENKRYWLEHSFKDIAVANNLEKFMFPVAPIILGVSGTSGLQNKHTFKNKVKDAAKHFLVKANMSYAAFVANVPDSRQDWVK